MMKHVMVDLETLATSGDAAIISIGAVAFDPDTGELGETFKVNVDGASSQAAGGHVDAKTVAWWFGQSAEARAHLNDPAPVSIKAALEAFSAFCWSNLGPEFYLWGNGATFDNTVLRTAYERLGLPDLPAPWRYTRDMCYRTVKNLHPEIELKREGVFHDALSDAISQARHLCAILAATKKAT